jgi:Xaa-Pro aminopeptidase
MVTATVGWTPTVDVIGRYRAVQRMAYAAAAEVAAGLEVGVSEREVARRLRETLAARGIEGWFHSPLVWFGARTAFPSPWNGLSFFPTKARLERGMPFILDFAPIVGGVAVDIAYAGVLGENDKFTRVMDALQYHRALILESLKARVPLAEIYRRVDALAARQGLVNRHQMYPGEALAHEVGAPRPPSRRFLGTFLGFGPGGIARLSKVAWAGLVNGTSIVWSGDKRCEHAPTPGLWAVEPHLAYDDIGAKFEELVVVSDDGAEWLDDELPHVTAWAARPT